MVNRRDTWQSLVLPLLVQRPYTNNVVGTGVATMPAQGGFVLTLGVNEFGLKHAEVVSGKVGGGGVIQY